MADLLGSLVGEYRIERQLGEGAMGKVFEAVHPVIGKHVAVKVLREEIARDEDQVARFIEEARAVTAIKHPAIVDVFGFGTLPDGQLYLVMDLLEGEPFSSYLRDLGPLDAVEARAWLLELLDAVAAAHDAGVVHRDLKPSNLFLVGKRGAQRLKVLDFGISRRVERREQLTRPNILLGSPAFMAPEQIRGESQPSSDLYAIGCIAFAMLAGRNVFPGDSVITVLNHHLLTPAPAPSSLVPSVPRTLDAFVQRLLEKEVSKRPASAREARALLASIDPTHDSPPTDELRPLAKTVVQRPPRETEPSLEPVVSSSSTVPGPHVSSSETVPVLAPLSSTQTNELPSNFTFARKQPGNTKWLVLTFSVVLAVGAVAVWKSSTEEHPVVTPVEVEPPKPPPAVVAVPEPTPPPVVELAPPPAVDRAPPSKPPVRVAEPTRPVRPEAPRIKAPSIADLRARLARDEAAVREGRGKDGSLSALLMVLEETQQQLSSATSAEARLEVQASLDEWEKNHLKR